MSDFRKLHVWRKAHALALNVHRSASQMPNTPYTSLRSQMVRSAMSISTNIVEGSSQHSRPEFGRFIRFALNSASELEYHLIVARDINAVEIADFDSLARQTAEVRKMLHGLLVKVMAPSEQKKRPVS